MAFSDGWSHPGSSEIPGMSTKGGVVSDIRKHFRESSEGRFFIPVGETNI